ncbi:MAG: hypothetical protein ACI865_003350 [Flavobacteriaceae bacterium]|jgi:hypothetical protein
MTKEQEIKLNKLLKRNCSASVLEDLDSMEDLSRELKAKFKKPQTKLKFEE